MMNNQMFFAIIRVIIWTIYTVAIPVYLGLFDGISNLKGMKEHHLAIGFILYIVTLIKLLTITDKIEERICQKSK